MVQTGEPVQNRLFTVGHSIHSMETFIDLLKKSETASLDVIRVGIQAPHPSPHQPENSTTDGAPWTLLSRPLGVALVPLLRDALVAGPDLLRGVSDRVPFDSFEKVPATSSLALIAPPALILYYHQSPTGRPQVRGRFPLGPGDHPCHYDLGVTDYQWESIVLRQGPQALAQSEARFLLTVSMGEPFGGNCFKLIATIVLLPPFIADAL
jgi:hypothetical protein